MSYQVYSTLQDAKNAADELKGKANWFCPLIKGGCITSCVCFVDSRVYTSKADPFSQEKDRHYAYPAYCGNEMFGGKEELNVRIINN